VLEPGGCGEYSEQAMGWMIHSSIPGIGNGFFSSPKHQDLLYVSPSFLLNEHLGYFLGDKAAGV
jgi:hypothetical protein